MTKTQFLILMIVLISGIITITFKIDKLQETTEHIDYMITEISNWRYQDSLELRL
jgi:hypothetical protein